MTRRSLHGGVLASLAALWALALALPAVRVGGGPTLRGFDLLARGWQGFDAGVFAWLANPLFIAAIVLCSARLHAAAGVTAGAGCVLALTSFGAGQIAASGGAPVPSFTLQSGFYLWLGCQFVLLGCCWAWTNRSRDAAQI